MKTSKKADTLTSICKDIIAWEREGIDKVNQEVEVRVRELFQVLGVKMKIEKPTKRHFVYVGFSNGKEIRVGGELKDTIKKIIILDKIRTTVVYSGQFTEKVDHYISILDAYNTRVGKTAGFKTMQ